MTKHVFGSNGCFLSIMLHDLSFACSQIELVEGVTKHVFGSNGCFLFIMLRDLSFVCSQTELVEGVTKHVFGSNGCFLFIMLQNLSFVCSQIELVEGVTKHVFGEGLDVVEQQWLVTEVNKYLEEQRGRPVEIAPAEDRAVVRSRSFL